MPKYFRRKLIKEILGKDADQFDVMLVPDTPGKFPRTGIDKVIEIYDNARLLRAILNEDEGVTYP